MSRPSSHRHALRAALAVTGRARRPLIHTAIVCALATSPLACAQPNDPKPDSVPTSSTTSTETSGTPTSVVNDETATNPRADCVDDEGQTSWECCVENRLDADGCDICEERFVSSDKPIACLSCGYFGRDMCCPDVQDMMEEVGLSNEGDPLGCAPWGPPAPPVYSARTLNDDSSARPCPSHFRRERRRTHATA